MSRNPNLRRALPVLLALLALVFASLPVSAQPARHPAARMQKVAVLGEGLLSWLRQALAGLWHPEMTKEGVSIDPDGLSGQQGDDDEGMSIDPNG